MGIYYTHTRDRVHSRARFSPFTLTSHGWAECVGKRIVVLRERCHNRSRYTFPCDVHYYVFHLYVGARLFVRAKRPVRPFPDEIERNTEHSLYSLLRPDGVADRFKGPRGVEDGARVIDGFGHASGHPCPTMTHRVTLRYITRHDDTIFFSFSFFFFSLFVYLYLFPFLFFFFLYISLTCAAVETSTTSCRCQRCARSSPATACARIVADPVARWTAACSSRAGGRTRRRLFARGRPCQPSWPSFRWIEIAATGWTALQTTVAVAPRDGACRFRHPLFLHSGHGRRDQRADPINTCPPRIRGRTVRTVPRHRAPRHPARVATST